MLDDTGFYISIGTALGVLSGFWKVYTWVSTKIGDRDKEIDAVRTKLADLELRVTKEFATRADLATAMAGVTNSVDKVVNRIDAFSVDFNRALVDLSRREGVRDRAQANRE